MISEYEKIEISFLIDKFYRVYKPKRIGYLKMLVIAALFIVFKRNNKFIKIFDFLVNNIIRKQQKYHLKLFIDILLFLIK